MDKVFICSPYRGNVESNIKGAKFAASLVIHRGDIPIVPHLYFPQFLKEDSQYERIQGIKMGVELMKDCDEMWIVGTNITAGMEYEIEEAKKIGIQVKLYDDNLARIDTETLILDERLDDHYRTVIKGLRFFSEQVVVGKIHGKHIHQNRRSVWHALAEHLIKKHLKLRTRRPTSEYYTDDLVEAVNEYVTFVIGEIETAKAECKSPVFAVEQKVDLSDYVDECYGTADMVIITEKVAQIVDLKLGRGVEVSAEDNDQLKAYGLGVLAMADMLYDIETVRLTIFQPRISNYSTWDISAEDLRKWGEEVLKPRGAMALIGAGDFHAGTWCRFCKARFQCRARAEEFLKMAQMEFAEPALLSDDEIAEVLAKADELSKWAADIYAYAQDQAIVHGKEWPGYKLVEGRSNRKYTSEEDVEAAAKAAGYTDIYKQSLIGITDMERLMGKKEFAKILGRYVYKPAGKITLVPESDKRKAITRDTAEADFTEVKNYE